MSEQQANAVDLDNMSLEDLKKLAIEEAANEATPPAQVTPARDDKGRFTSQEQPPAAQAKTEEDDEPVTTVYRREIDLGDGAGKEVFEANSIEELLDKIVEAKTHASRKIREQQAEIKQIKQSHEQTNADDEFVLSQELMSNPTQAIKKLFKKTTGLDIEEFKTVAERSRAFEAAQVQQTENQKQEAASSAFMTSHPEYLANEANGKRLVREINSIIGEAKANGRDVDYGAVLEQAYTSLKGDGLLQLKDESQPAAKATPQVATQTPTPALRRASSLSSRAPVVTQARNTEPTEEELYAMPLDQLKALAERQGRG